MKTIHWILLFIVIAISALIIIKTADIEPRVDERIDLNWRFTFEDDSSFSKINLDEHGWQTVSLPHDWMITLPVSEENESGTAGGFYPSGVGWYRKHLDLSAYESKDQFYLVFDGVYMNSDVWINGHHLGKHTYGYIGFNYDISDYIRKDSINIIAVRTDCSKMPVDRWYSGAGIYRHVKLIAADKLHFPVLNTKITAQPEGEAYLVNSEIKILNNDKRSKRFKVRSDLLAPDGSLVKSTVRSVSVDGKSSVHVSAENRIEDPVLWSDKDPSLYEIRSFLMYRKRVIDNLDNTFGLRDIVFSPDSGFILNGEKVWLKGVCLHHDGGALGAAVPDATWEYRVKALKELGVNALRLAHNPHSPELLDICDKLGVFVIDEMYDKWELVWGNPDNNFDFPGTYEDDLAYFIQRDRNHPSVIAWSMGNETLEQLDDPPAGRKWFSKLDSITRIYDTTRMITAALHPGGQKKNHEIPSSLIEVQRLISYNYRTDSFASWHKQYPEKVWLATETKAYNEHRNSNFEEISYMDNSWLDMEKFVAGQFIWAGIDYFGESPGWPYRSFNNGLLRTNGLAKPYAYYTQSIYSEDPMVKIAVVDNDLADSLNNYKTWQISWSGAPVVRHWNFGKKEKELEILVYTNCEEVDLKINNTNFSTLKKSDFEDGVIKTKVSYEPGLICASGFYRDGKGKIIEVKDSILTSLEPSMIMMKPDKTEMLADGNDVVHIETSVADSIGTTYPTASHRINYEVQGPGKIKVIDNGNPADHEPYHSASKKVYKGTHLLIIQSTVEPGDLTIRASSEGLLSASVKLKSLPPKDK